MKRCLLICLPALMIPAIALAADKAGDGRLRRLVGDDVGLCIELHDLAGQHRKLRKSEFARRLHASPLFDLLRRSKPVRDLAGARSKIEELTGTPLPQFLNGLFGRSVILAVYPSRTDKPTGVLLTRTADRKTLQDALAAWHRAEPKRGVEEVPYRGQTYVRFAKKDDSKPLYYAALGDVLALSDREAAVKKVIRLSLTEAGDGQSNSVEKSLASLKIYAEARKSLAGEPVATAFVNPRQWDAALGFTAGSTSEKRVPAVIWQSCRWMMGSLRMDDGLIFDAVVQFDPKALPAASTKSLQRLQGKPAFLDRVPADVLLAVAGRFDPIGIRNALQLAEEGDNAGDFKKMRRVSTAMMRGFDPITHLLPKLRPGYGLFIVGRSSDGGRVPFTGLAGFEIEPPAKTDDNSGWRDKLESGLSNVMQFLVTVHNVKESKRDNPQLASVKSRRRKDVSLHWVETIATYQPAFGISAGYLVFSGDPKLIEAFVAGPPKRLIDDRRFREWRKRFFPGHQQVAWLNIALLREHLRKHETFFASKWSKANDAEQTAGKVKTLLEALGLFDGAFSAVKTGEARVRFTLGVVTAKPQE